MVITGSGGRITGGKCDICGGSEQAVVATTGRFGMPLRNVVCTTCGFVYVDPRPSPEDLEAFYRSDYEKTGLYFGEGYTPQELENSGAQVARARLEYLSSRAPDLVPGSALEIGCGAGSFLAVLRSAGWEVEGVEPVARLAAHTARRGFAVQDTTFERAEFEAGFDLVVLFHVLEHFHSPTEALILCARLLRSGGTLYLEVPDIEKPNRARPEDFFQVAHLSTFSSATLSRLLLKCGFTIVVVENAGGFLRAIVRKAPAGPPGESEPLPRDDWEQIRDTIERRRRWYMRPLLWRERLLQAAVRARRASRRLLARIPGR